MDTTKHLLLFLQIILFSTSSAYQIGGRAVEVLDGSANWFKAHELCIGRGMRLLETHNRGEHDELIMLAKQRQLKHIWLGGSITGGGRWKWHSTGNDIEYSPWSPSQPSAGGQQCLERCAEVTDDIYSWNDMFCTDGHLTVICQEADAQIEKRKLKADLDAVKNDLELQKTNLLLSRHSADQELRSSVSVLEMQKTDALNKLKSSKMELEGVKRTMQIQEFEAQNKLDKVKAELERLKKVEPIKCPEFKANDEGSTNQINSPYVLLLIVVGIVAIGVIVAKNWIRPSYGDRDPIVRHRNDKISFDCEY